MQGVDTLSVGMCWLGSGGLDTATVDDASVSNQKRKDGEDSAREMLVSRFAPCLGRLAFLGRLVLSCRIVSLEGGLVRGSAEDVSE